MAYKPFDLTGKVALVTGGNGGIGLGMAEAMAQAGADVVIWGTNADKNAAAEARLKAHGVRVLTQRIDVSEEQQVVDGMAQAAAEMGRLDTVIANAGIGGGARSFAEMSTETWRRVMGVNLDGVFFTFREACKHMVARAQSGDSGGSLVVTSSLSAVHGAARNEAYSSAKTAVLGMVRGLAVEYARYGIRANAVLPGWIATDMTAGAQGNDKFNEQVIKRVPTRRWGEPEDFGGIAVYLASDASRFHTGDSILIDGGYAIF
ncbi:SDR family NAD(P)-dependent oxidoreductase [Phenylobacterium sp.]|jgi:NAD(P)-dependent dehydrogenase (short-subunit alcohol dehydrogenase family)|uniref:SDR family NAD(P)-dependent oxidoreductase n=1 Tax=Phenylobacterium sp. TaxID=1871053 RepID=UPI002E361154|nr:SDR family oxidoreductase [Phenylobacterium sp.]HEX2558931.1 SDR family oxidoreductase [Phenylobacterium sp.]